MVNQQVTIYDRIKAGEFSPEKGENIDKFLDALIEEFGGNDELVSEAWNEAHSGGLYAVADTYENILDNE